MYNLLLGACLWAFTIEAVAGSGYTIQNDPLENLVDATETYSGVTFHPGISEDDEDVVLLDFKNRNLSGVWGRLQNVSLQDFKAVVDWQKGRARLTGSTVIIQEPQFQDHGGTVGSRVCDIIKVCAYKIECYDTLFLSNRKTVLIAPEDSVSLIRAMILEPLNNIPAILARGIVDFNKLDDNFSGATADQQFFIKGARITFVFERARLQALLQSIPVSATLQTEVEPALMVVGQPTTASAEDPAQETPAPAEQPAEVPAPSSEVVALVESLASIPESAPSLPEETTSEDALQPTPSPETESVPAPEAEKNAAVSLEVATEEPTDNFQELPSSEV